MINMYRTLFTVKQSVARIEVIANKMFEKLAITISTMEQKQTTVATKEDEFSFPITTMEDLLNLEQLLADTEIKNRMVLITLD